MQCPPPIADVLAEILTTGLLRIRSLGWNINAARCAIEADHLHNLPGLLTNYKLELLDYYWHVERISFIERGTPDNVADFEPLWRALESHFSLMQKHALAG